MRTCDHCDRPYAAKGLCNTHYMKMRRTGTLERLRRPYPKGGRSHREKHLLNRYGMLLTDYEKLQAGQGGCCAICGEPQEPHSMFVDHDHETGEVRGLLCRDCNTLLGMVESREDCDTVLAGAMAYCEAHCV